MIENVEEAFGISPVLDILPIFLVLVVISTLFAFIIALSRDSYPSIPRLPRPNAKGIVTRLGRILRRK